MNTPISTNEARISEEVLPAEVSIQSDTWMNRYRNFPVFSRTWYRHRNIAFGAVLLILWLILSLVSFLTQDNLKDYLRWTVPFFLFGTSLFSVGQGIAVWVRQRNYSARKEGGLIIGALVFGATLSIFLAAASHRAVDVYLYPEVLEATSQVKQDEKLALLSPQEKERKRVLEENEKILKAARAERDKARGPVANAVINFLAIFPMSVAALYWGSFFDLIVYFRQRSRLLEALRKQELEREQNARREAELKLSVLVAQVEPHFLFNTLAGVRSAILSEPLRATAIVDHLVDYLRSTIPQMRGDGSVEQGRLAKQLETVKAYLSLMQARIPRLSFSIDSEVKDAVFPPLMLISLVENAIKHGIEPKIGPAHISVTARYFDAEDEEKLEVMVADDGVGFGGTTSGTGIGLSNIRERLESMYGKRASLTLKARPEGGVAAIIVLPLASE